eukprot:COSAG02_NODE_3789_length_6229_cov_3.678630_10_plen_257_part_00
MRRGRKLKMGEKNSTRARRVAELIHFPSRIASFSRIIRVFCTPVMHDARLSAVTSNRESCAPRRARARAITRRSNRPRPSLSLRWMACVEGALLPVDVAGRVVLACARAVAPLLYTRYRTPGQMQKGRLAKSVAPSLARAAQAGRRDGRATRRHRERYGCARVVLAFAEIVASVSGTATVKTQRTTTRSSGRSQRRIRRCGSFLLVARFHASSRHAAVSSLLWVQNESHSAYYSATLSDHGRRQSVRPMGSTRAVQ